MKHHLAILSVILLMANGMLAETQLADTLREVVVTGARSETDVRLLPLAVSVVDEKMLTEKPEPNILPTLVENVPGLFVTERGVLGYSVSTGGSGAIKVRGIGGSPNTDVLVLIDGLPQYAGLYGHPVADNYQTMMAERVEVVRGPASMLYGNNAMGGVLNIVTHQPKRDTTLTNIHLTGGSYYTLDAGAANRVRRGKFFSAVGFNYSRTNGHRAGMGFEQYNGYVRLGYDIDPHWRLTATGNVSYFDTHNPGTVAAPIEDSRFRILRGMAALSVENSYDEHRFPTSGAIRAYFNGGRHRINEGHTAGAPAPATDYLHTDFMAGVSAYQAVSFFRGNRITFGFDYQHFGGHAWNRLLADGADKEIIRKTLYELAAYVDFRQHIVSWFALDAGCRADYHTEAGWSYAPQAGVSFILPRDAQIKALASRGFRNPTIRELYMYAPANADLLPVNLWNYELSYHQSLLNNRLSLGANVFYLHAKNNIETRMIDGRPRNVNTGELKNAGCEVEIRYRIWKGLHLDANYSFLHMENPVLAAPEHKLNIALMYHHDRFHIGSSWQYIHGLYTSISTNPAIPNTKENFLLWNAHASVRIWKGLWATLKAENLLAQKYEINAGFPMPLTTIVGGFRWTF